MSTSITSILREALVRPYTEEIAVLRKAEADLLRENAELRASLKFAQLERDNRTSAYEIGVKVISELRASNARLREALGIIIRYDNGIGDFARAKWVLTETPAASLEAIRAEGPLHYKSPKLLAYHGVKTRATSELICSTGFNKGTYFAFDIRNAITHGGEFILAVELEDCEHLWKGEPDGWQFWIRDALPPESIIWYGRIFKRIGDTDGSSDIGGTARNAEYSGNDQPSSLPISTLEAIRAEAKAEEREACAKIADDACCLDPNCDECDGVAIAEAIRALGDAGEKRDA